MRWYAVCICVLYVPNVPYLLVRYTFYVQPAAVNEDKCDRAHTIKNNTISHKLLDPYLCPDSIWFSLRWLHDIANLTVSSCGTVMIFITFRRLSNNFEEKSTNKLHFNKVSWMTTHKQVSDTLKSIWPTKQMQISLLYKNTTKDKCHCGSSLFHVFAFNETWFLFTDCNFFYH